MRNICMVVSYDGTGYYGFQTQPGHNTIQDKIEAAILSLTGETVKIISSGRTDAGVHAYGQVFNFATHSSIPLERWSLALNTRLPKDIVIRSAREVPPDFHARRSAKRKTYRYTINANQFPDVFHRHFQFHHPTKLDVEEMRKALAHVVGTYDYTSFASRKSTKASHVRTIYEAWIEQDLSGAVPGTRDQGVLHTYMTGNGFLHNMVRIIMGTLLRVGQGKLGSEEIPRILAAKDRSAAGPTAVAHGLALWDVAYDFDSVER
ncbi:MULTISPECIES: tRNA pseudouridine(38-40) synthase TruA [unclassified Paenibacillus]|uniref:tRNA pseudouridine(38-40) synthase TruA n=1 Tax=unclassified Paenibacillus TaxID=185978 RepID=UPI001C112980|nr:MULTISPECIES: tRNA pseudouridine(38-40) synthase TruA [unclassified Paenibacillus]MBU5443793.1 tRNA pseudouridine(38-40) synthase TruA [Paenibacillus sp. MSJ-34]CAH0120708.1 tRNA pseudouridine synthase A [Paenibacillus sp. CECT 9249]